mmetsp:Transcript_13690/g.41355  ORF Transcript_13690/g.41355 Transcript_13690/m.41355 type:complete len:716 (+) Transcript_13690:749-2896(+)
MHRLVAEGRLLLGHGDRLGQVAGLVHVEAAQHGEVVAQQLQGHDVDHRLHELLHLRHLDEQAALCGGGLQQFVALVGEHNEPRVTRTQLLDHTHHLAVAGAVGGDDDDGHGLVHKRQGAVLHLTRQHTLAVDERHLLDLEGGLEGSGVVVAAPEHQHAGLALQVLRHLAHAPVQGQRAADDVRQLLQSFHHRVILLLLLQAVLGHDQRQHGNRHDLRGVRLGGRHTDLAASIDMDATVGGSGDGGSHGVGDAQAERALLLGVVQCLQGVGSLSGLGHEHAEVVPHDGGLPVQQIAGQLQSHRHAGKALDGLTAGHGGVIGGAAGNEDHAAGALDGGQVVQQTPQRHLALVRVHNPGRVIFGRGHTAHHCLGHRLGLLVDLLLHEVVELALHDARHLHLQNLVDALHGAAAHGGGGLEVDVLDGVPPVVDVHHVMVLQGHHPPRVLDQRAGVAGEERLEGAGRGGLAEGGVGHLLQQLRPAAARYAVLFHETQQKGGALLGGDELSGEVGGLDQQCEGALQLTHHLTHHLEEGDAGVDDLGTLVHHLAQLRNDFRVGLGLEALTLLDQEVLESLVVGDDAVVHHHEFVGVAGGVGVRVDGGGLAVGGPPGVPNRRLRLQHLLAGGCGVLCVDSAVGQLLQAVHLAGLLDDDQLLLEAVQAHAGRVIPAVFQLAETTQHNAQGLLAAAGYLVLVDTENTAHDVEMALLCVSGDCEIC